MGRAYKWKVHDYLLQEVAIRYPKAPGHVYRAVAQPDVQWKMQQVQDLSDYVLRALSIVNAAIEATKSAETLDGRQVTTVTKNLQISYLFYFIFFSHINISHLVSRSNNRQLA